MTESGVVDARLKAEPWFRSRRPWDGASSRSFRPTVNGQSAPGLVGSHHVTNPTRPQSG